MSVSVYQGIHDILAQAQATATAAATATVAPTAASSSTSTTTGGSSLGALQNLVGVIIFFFVAFAVIFWLSLVFCTWCYVLPPPRDFICLGPAPVPAAVFN